MENVPRFSMAEDMTDLWHSGKYRSLDDIADAIPGIAIGRAAVSRVMESKSVHPAALAAIERFLGSEQPAIWAFRHRGRWTRKILDLYDSTGKIALHCEGMDTKVFKARLRTTFESDEHFQLPTHASFVNNTGQWLKPLLRRMLKKPMRIDVYVSDPGRPVRNSAGALDMIHMLGVLEFLWSLPTASLPSQVEMCKGTLRIFTYDASDMPAERIALFSNDLVARSPQVPLAPAAHFANHPGCRNGSVLLHGSERINLYLQGCREYEQQQELVAARLVEGPPSSRLPDIRHRITWTSAGFVFQDFDIDPSRFLAPP